MISHDILSNLWFSATDTEMGLKVLCSDPKTLQKHLYSARDIIADNRLRDFGLFLPATNDCVFIVRKSVELEA